jgi:predicted nucleic acid-binding protein
MLDKIESGITEEDFEVALNYSKKYGLLSNDAIHVATMTQHGIK